jgi:heme-degrading monooxygenase HmoA
MIDDVIVIGDLKLRHDAAIDDHDRLGERMYGIVSQLPGFLSVKSFKSDDGEELTVFRFSSEDALEAWRTHPEHVEAMKRAKFVRVTPTGARPGPLRLAGPPS